MNKIVVEEENKTSLAAVYYGGVLGEAVVRELRKQGIIVRHLETKDKDIPFWEKPEYLITFEGETVLVNDRVVKILGRIKHDEFWVKETAKKIVKFTLTGKEKELLIVGDKMTVLGQVRERRSLKERLASFEMTKPKKPHKNRWVGLAVLLMAIVVSFPFFWLVGATILGFGHLAIGARAFRAGNIAEVEAQVHQARIRFDDAKNVLRFGNGSLAEKYGEYLTLGDKAAESLELGTKVVAEAKGQRFEELKLDLAILDNDLGFIDGRITDLYWFKDWQEQIKAGRQTISRARVVVDNLGEIFPFAQGQSKTYLVVFQNSAELRPTGGFIGSYALVSFDSGQFAGYKIYDIYSADGNLKGHIQPPDEILHYLGQPDWYMRDANWAPDWQLTAQRLEWFLEKETGITVSGVVGVDLGAVQKLLTVTGPITVLSNEEVTADNFFEKAEYAAEINFFPGSKQKPQFLTEVAQGMLDKITSQTVDLAQLAKTGLKILEEKNVLLYSNSASVEKMVKEYDWAGEISPGDLMVVDANFGANKANYFIRRGVRIDQEISKGGDVDTTVTVTYKNESPNNTWPGGVYKNYVRFLIPSGSKVANVDLGDGRTASFSAILTADVIAGVSKSQFLVFTNPEQNYLSVGTYLEVPVLETKTISLKYRQPTRLDFGLIQQDFKFTLVRQPGTGSDVVDYALDYPVFLTPIFSTNPGAEISVLALPQKLVYNTNTRIDRTIEVKFRRQ